MERTLLEQVKDLERQIGSIISSHDLADLERSQQGLVEKLKRQLVDARLDVRDYAYAETRIEQLKFAEEARGRLAQARQFITKISEFGIFGAADVAQLSAHIERIVSSIL